MIKKLIRCFTSDPYISHIRINDRFFIKCFEHYNDFWVRIDGEIKIKIKIKITIKKLIR